VPLLEDFLIYSEYGRSLANLHLKYETFENTSCVISISDHTKSDSELYKVEKMRFRKKDDKSSIHFNQFVTISNIPTELYEYRINGKSPIEWVMDRYVTKIDADSGIANDPNDFSEDPKYVFNLLLSVISMTTQILDLQKTLPKLEIPK
jgi:predicted helicase